MVFIGGRSIKFCANWSRKPVKPRVLDCNGPDLTFHCSIWPIAWGMLGPCVYYKMHLDFRANIAVPGFCREALGLAFRCEKPGKKGNEVAEETNRCVGVKKLLF